MDKYLVKIVLQQRFDWKINKYWCWTHWLCLMILGSKFDLCCGHKDSLYPVSASTSEERVGNWDWYSSIKNNFSQCVKKFQPFFRISWKLLTFDPNIQMRTNLDFWWILQLFKYYSKSVSSSFDVSLIF